MTNSEVQEPTLTNFVNELTSLIAQKPLTLNVVRNITLTLQLYAEHYVNEIVLEQVKESAKKEVKEHLTFPQKLRILKNLNCLDDNTERVLSTLNSIRDLLIHNLMINVKEFNVKLEGVKFGFKYNWRITGEAKPKMDKEIDLVKIYEEHKSRITKYDQLNVSSAVVIGLLHYHLMKLRGKEPNEIIDVEPIIREGKFDFVELRAWGKIIAED